MAVDFVGVQTMDHLNRIFQMTNLDFAVSSSFSQAVSALKRTGHARFRRGPPTSSLDPHAPSTSSQSEDKSPKETPAAESTVASEECFLNRFVNDTVASYRSTSSSSLVSSLEFGGVGGSVLNGKQLPCLGIVAPAPAFSAKKPPLPSSHRKRCSADRAAEGAGRENYPSSRNVCHCNKRRKITSKREIRKVPIVGSKVSSIPADDYSWKKYGEKKIDGSPHPRVYYKCNSEKGCPARKRVELAPDDSKMLLVTYDGEHRHRHRHRHAPTPLPTSLTGFSIQSK